MQILIAEHLHNFKILYPRASFIPKMHYMLHLPSQMREFGPLRHHWCMRFDRLREKTVSLQGKSTKIESICHCHWPDHITWSHIPSLQRSNRDNFVANVSTCAWLVDTSPLVRFV